MQFLILHLEDRNKLTSEKSFHRKRHRPPVQVDYLERLDPCFEDEIELRELSDWLNMGPAKCYIPC